jgi:hypothetical protein
MVAYNKREDLRNVINREESQKSMLTEYFQMNNVNPFAHSFLYREFPEHYRWDRTEKEWLQRKQRTQIGWMLYVCLAEGERYYLCILLNYVKGATSFGNLKLQVLLQTLYIIFLTWFVTSCVWWYVTKTLYALCHVIYFYYISYVFVLGSIGFTCFVGTITDLIEHDYIFRRPYICHVLRSM